MEITGRIRRIGMPVDVSPTFRKRELVVTTEEQYPQHISLDFIQEKTELLNSFQVNDWVRVSINIRGREWQDPNTGEVKYFNTLVGWRIDRVQEGQQPYMQQPMQGYGYGQMPPQGYGQVPQYGQPQMPPQGGGFQPQAQPPQYAQQTPNANTFQQANNPNAMYQQEEEGGDDLPF